MVLCAEIMADEKESFYVKSDDVFFSSILRRCTECVWFVSVLRGLALPNVAEVLMSILDKRHGQDQVNIQLYPTLMLSYRIMYRDVFML